MKEVINISPEDIKLIEKKLSNRVSKNCLLLFVYIFNYIINFQYLSYILSQALSNDSSLTSLDLSHIIFNEESFVHLCEVLKKNSKIIELKLNHIDNLLFDKLLDLLDHNVYIRKIDIGADSIHINEMNKKIDNKLFYNVSNLQNIFTFYK